MWRLLALWDSFTSTKTIVDQWCTEHGMHIRMRDHTHISASMWPTVVVHTTSTVEPGTVFNDEFRLYLGIHAGWQGWAGGAVKCLNLNFLLPKDFIRGNMTVYRANSGNKCSILSQDLCNPLLLQDNARSHVARVILDYFEHNQMNLLPWSPRSSDFSPEILWEEDWEICPILHWFERHFLKRSR